MPVYYIQDSEELRKFEAYMIRRIRNPDESPDIAYAEVYGEVVFEDKSDE